MATPKNTHPRATVVTPLRPGGYVEYEGVIVWAEASGNDLLPHQEVFLEFTEQGYRAVAHPSVDETEQVSSDILRKP